jgi:hypothetical protein
MDGVRVACKNMEAVGQHTVDILGDATGLTDASKYCDVDHSLCRPNAELRDLSWSQSIGAKSLSLSRLLK